MSEEVTDRLIERLDRLDRTNRRWKVISGATAAALAVLVLVAAAAPRAPLLDQGGRPVGGAVSEVRAKRFLLVDDTGKLRAVLGAATGGAVSLGLLDNDDKIRSVLIVDANGTPRLEMLGADETRRVVLSVFPNRSGLGVFGEGARGGAILDVAADGTVTFGLTDRKEHTRAGLLLLPDGTALLNLSDTTQRVRAALGIGNDGSPGLGMWDPDGKRVWQAPPVEHVP
jgi:hypothetical protein